MNERIRRPGRRRRRVDAPPTNPEADRSEDVAAPRERDPGPDADPRSVRRHADPRDQWIAEQRPPHWD